MFPFIALNVWLIFQFEISGGRLQHMSHLTGIRQADASCCGALLKACEGGGRWREATGMKAVKFAVDVSVVIILNYVFWCDFKAWNWWKWWKLVGILGLHVWFILINERYHALSRPKFTLHRCWTCGLCFKSFNGRLDLKSPHSLATSRLD